MLNRHLASLEAAGQIEDCLRDLSDLTRRLQQVPLWRPAAGLGRQAEEARRIILDMRSRLDRRLVVTLIGPSGAGKSTLLNALAGVDDLSPVGLNRPTTRDLVVLSNDAESVRQLLDTTGGQALTVRSSPAAEALDHVILVDTPDTDSTLRDEHLEILMRTVDRSDVLICVFDAQNPKRRDHADLMAPVVRRFHGASLVAVVNKCDRLDEEELAHSVGPDFETYLREAWDARPEALLFVSARRHLQQPRWDPQAGPRHAADQFDRLRDLIYSTFNRAGYGPDRRVANARRLRDHLMDQVARAVAQDRPALQQAVEKLNTADSDAMLEALTALKADERRQLLGVQVRLYQALAQRWLGPVGWIVALWSRLIVFGSGLAFVLRFGNPVRQLLGLISSWRRLKESRSALEALNDQARVDTALATYRKVLLTRWPEIAELLIKGGFDSSVRNPDAQQTRVAAQNLENLWEQSLDREIDRSADALSRPILQLLFNAPSLGLLGYVGWLTAARFFQASYLSSDFFLHALLTIAIVLLVSFFLLQGLARLLTGRDRIQKRAFQHVEKAAAEHPMRIVPSHMDQVAALLSWQ